MFAVASVKGSPGVTTTVMALAASWPADADGGVRPVVVEADTAGGDLAARLGLAHVPGLLDVAAAARRPRPGSVLGAAQELPFGVRAVLAPAGAGQCREAVRLLGADAGRVLRGGPDDVGTVLVDVGRVETLDQGLAGVADGLVLVTRGGVDALAHLFPHRELAALTRRVVVAVVGPCAYGPAEIAAVSGAHQVVRVPWTPASAAVLCGTSAKRLRASGWRRSPLLAAAERLAGHLLHAAPSPRQAPDAPARAANEAEPASSAASAANEHASVLATEVASA
ncbi:hypothetical protein ACTWP5_29410 [Streptomyces sp. 4N509B]|uniref:hypothetical protein n=1 Tax=Streptomyces sp. 4N509B TaxID=3457413 RepID=UPI003FD17CA2